MNYIFYCIAIIIAYSIFYFLKKYFENRSLIISNIEKNLKNACEKSFGFTVLSKNNFKDYDYTDYNKRQEYENLFLNFKKNKLFLYFVKKSFLDKYKI